MSELSSSKPIVLVVDDVATNIDILVEGLSSDYDVRVAINGERALQSIAVECPDLILLDIMMPRMDGYEVCRRVRELPLCRDVPIIFLTAKNNPHDEKKAIESGAADYITKPFSIDIVKVRIRHQLTLKENKKQLKEQNRKLQEVAKIREQMTNMIIHDMRNPLGAIQNYVEMSSFQDPKEYPNYFRIIGNFTKRLHEFINDILILARTESEQLMLSCSDAELQELLDEVIFTHEQRIHIKNISLKKDIPEEPITVRVDKRLFSRVIDNLISNAIKYSPSGTEISIKVCCTDHLHVTIGDQGMGIPDESKDSIFEPYQIAKMKITGVHQIGLGLAFCKKAIDAHQGRIWVENAVPSGSVFHITIPLKS